MPFFGPPCIGAEIAQLKVMNPCRKVAAEEELPLRQIFNEVSRAVDAGGNDVVAFAAIVNLCRWEMRRSTAVQ